MVSQSSLEVVLSRRKEGKRVIWEQKQYVQRHHCLWFIWRKESWVSYRTEDTPMVEDVDAVWISVLQKYRTRITLLQFFLVFYHSLPTQQIGRGVVLYSTHLKLLYYSLSPCHIWGLNLLYFIFPSGFWVSSQLPLCIGHSAGHSAGQLLRPGSGVRLPGFKS